MLERIERGQLDELAGNVGFEMAEEEASEYLALTEYVFEILDELDEMPSATSHNIAGTRNPGRRPVPGEDPYNAIVRWCSVGSDREGLLSGKRVALKDSMAIAGVPMTCGSKIFDGFIPSQDSVVADRILRAGGEIVAITNMDNLALSGGGDTSAYGSTLCPFDTGRTAGGSSSGAAAGLWYDGIDIALGTDQGGSVRVPAAFCGVVGLKPTHGLVPYTGIVGIDQTFDHVGPLGRTVHDVGLLMKAIAGKHDSDPRQREVPSIDFLREIAEAPDDLRDVRIGVVREGFSEEVDDEEDVGKAVLGVIDRMRELGADIAEVPLPEHAQSGGVVFGCFVEGLTATMDAAGNGHQWSGRYWEDLATALRSGLVERANELPPTVKVILMVGAHLARTYPGLFYAKAQNLRPWLRAGYERALADVDVLVMPTVPGLPLHDSSALPISEHVMSGWSVVSNTSATDMTGHPALSIPAAEAEGLPIGVMLIGRHFDDARLLAVARSYEASVGWRPHTEPTAHVQVPEISASGH